MKEIINKPWDYILFEKDNEYILSVTCGSVAIFEINIQLSDSESKNYLEKGINYIDVLAKEIQYKPSEFSSRNIDNFSV